MTEKASDPGEVADMLEAIARRLRTDPAFGRGARRETVPLAPATPLAPEGPSIGPVDVFTDGNAVTVTAQTQNADASSLRVSLLDGRLLIGLGEGAHAIKRDFALPAAVDEEAAVATFRNGVLDVVLPLKR